MDSDFKKNYDQDNIFKLQNNDIKDIKDIKPMKWEYILLITLSSLFCVLLIANHFIPSGYNFARYMIIIIYLVVLMFLTFSLISPSDMSKIKHISLVGFFTLLVQIMFYSFISSIGLAILSVIIFNIIYNKSVNLVFLITIHLICLLICSPYFIPLFVISLIIYLFKLSPKKFIEILIETDKLKLWGILFNIYKLH